MLGSKTTIATLPVRDLAAARPFYETVLGLAVADDAMSGVVTYRTGESALQVYESTHAGANEATAVTWRVGDDIDSIVAALQAKGVGFERYDMPETRHEGDVHVFGDLRVAWFRDPDRNIVCLVNG